MTIEIDQLPKIYLKDTTTLKVEIFHLKSSAEKRIPRILSVKFQQFNFHIPSNRWYLSKSDLQAMLPEFTILRIEPDTVWFSPWYSDVKYLPVQLQVDVPPPFELISAIVTPDSVPILYRGTSLPDQTSIHLGTIQAKRDRRFQEFTFKANSFIPSGTATSIPDIRVKVEIGQWKPSSIVLKHRMSKKQYSILVYFETPVDDSADHGINCIQIRSQNEPLRFFAGLKDSVACNRIRHIKLLSVDEIE